MSLNELEKKPTFWLNYEFNLSLYQIYHGCFLHTLIPTVIAGKIIFKNRGFLRPLYWSNVIIWWRELVFIPWDRCCHSPGWSWTLDLLALSQKYREQACATKAGKITFFLLILVAMTVTGDLWTVEETLAFLSLSTYEKPDSNVQPPLRVTVLRLQQRPLTAHAHRLVRLPLNSSGHEDLVLRPTALASRRLLLF